MSLWNSVRAEWTKFWSMRLGGGVAVVIAGAVATIPAIANLDSVPVPMFSYDMVHRPFAGDGSITAQVTSHEGVGGGGAAGVVLKESTERTAPYAALLLTADRGVRLHTFRTEIAGSLTATPAWLRLDRSGDAITGYESADGVTWHEVGTLTLPGLPEQIEAGLIVAAGASGPPGCAAQRQCPVSTATFEDVTVPGPDQPWRHAVVGEPWSQPGSFTESGGVLRVSGGGDFRPFGNFDPTIADSGLFSLVIGLPALVAVGVLFVTSEYTRGLHRTTFAATPRRWHVLVAKALVLGGAVVVVELVALAAGLAWLVSHVESTGIAPIEYLHPAIVKAVAGTAVTLTAVALTGLALGWLFRRPAAAIASTAALLILPAIVSQNLPIEIGRWVVLASPVGAGAGLTEPPVEFVTIPAPPAGPSIVPTPWVGGLTLIVIVSGLLGLAAWRLHRRDA
ncbi:MAG: ABC transporter permease subunit [Frankia sp.]|nr:ABC transporter permease subunit [Frankia sp.]